MLFIFRYLWILGVYTFSSWIYITFVNLNFRFDVLTNWVCEDYDNFDKVYDYIVVGAGSAGCIVAARLAENPATQVLLIEAGGHPSPLFDIPLSAPMLQQSPYDWQYKTEPQENACLGMNEKRSVWPRGKVLGGTSRLNYMVYLRGHLSDYDSWRSDDCEHWTRHEIRTYFKRSEHQRGKYANDSKHHSVLGPMAVSDLEHTSGLVQGLLGAAEELGLAVGDLNGAEWGTGFMQAQATSNRGARHSADQILAGRSNVNIMLHTQVVKVLLKQDYEAYGVRCERHGRQFTVRARRDVILSAGVVGSPHILLLSGIGPSDHLSQHQIKTAVDLPVGESLQDHVASGLDLVITNQSSPLSWQTAVNLLNPLYYLLYGQGPLTHPGCEVVGLVNTETLSPSSPPDLQFMALPGGLSSDAGVVLKPAMGITDQLWRGYFADLVGTPVATLLPTVSHPQSRGYVRLQSNNYQDPPLINPRYLSHPNDVKVLIRGLELLTRIAETKAMAQVGSVVYSKPLPPCSHLEFRSTVYWECYVRHITVSAYHPVGTCHMGSVTNPSAVVDHTLRVHGTSRLRVVDASVMPTLPSSNINAAVAMIAEKAADMIKSYWHLQRFKCYPLEVFLIDRPANCFAS